LARGYVQKQH
jgi:hypothetical protein